MLIVLTRVPFMMLMTRQRWGRRNFLLWARANPQRFFISASPASSPVSFPWLDTLGAFQQRDPRIFLTLFEKLVVVSKEVFEKFMKALDNKNTSLVLPT